MVGPALGRFYALLASSDARTIIVVLTVLTALYLLWQISLSGAVLMAKTVEESRRLSDLARLTVGLGTALFTFRVGWQRLGFRLVLPLACLLGFGAMKAENTIVNHLADRASAQERLEAKTVLLFNTALNRNLVTLPDLAQDIASDPVKVKAFSKVLGLAIWNDAALIAEVTAKTYAVFNALYGQEMYDRIDAGYDRYLEAFQRNAEKLRALEDALANLNFAAYARELNGQLAPYAACADESCRRTIAERIAGYTAKALPGLSFTFDPEAFCRAEDRPVRYIMGRAVSGSAELVCAASEQALHDHARKQVEDLKRAALKDLDAPEEIKQKLLAETRLSLAEWRDLWQGQVAEEIERMKTAEFGDPEQYGRGGKLAEEGRDYAVSVFLPPVALGFSVTVCFLHFTSLCVTLCRRLKICCAAFGLIYFLPYVFAPKLPLSGLAGLYAGWLVFWQSRLFPFGLLKNLII